MITPIKPLELMNGQFSDFIGTWENHVPKSLCQKYIKFFDEIVDTDRSSNTFNLVDPEILDGTQQFSSTNLGRKDISILIDALECEFTSEINQYLQACLLDYVDKYGQLKPVKLISSTIKMQRTPPEGGYHQWHFEAGSPSHCSRVLVWAIYLNDLPDNEGETEFLYQKRRIKPKAGTCVFWPAAMTHVHRGLTVYSENKYILTGWYHMAL